MGTRCRETALKVPGGLTGIELLGGELTATAEIAGSPSDVLINQVYLAEGGYTAVVLPLKIRLGNPVLGNNCYIGSDAHPIVLNLTDGTTSPPPPAKPISGSKGTLEVVGKRKITRISGNKLVDNSFAVPAATGCGTNALLDAVDHGPGQPRRRPARGGRPQRGHHERLASSRRSRPTRPNTPSRPRKKGRNSQGPPPGRATRPCSSGEPARRGRAFDENLSGRPGWAGRALGESQPAELPSSSS